MRIIYLLVFACLISLTIQAQVSHKLGLQLYQKLHEPRYANSPQLKKLLVKGEPSVIRGLTERHHGTYKYAAGDISSVAIPYRELQAFSQEQGIISIEGSMTSGIRMMDTARIVNNIDSAQQGIAPLLQAYQGTGVIVGIIDGGIYFRHQDFRRANGNTRILSLWDQKLTSAPSPSPYGYGAEWDSTAINNGQCNSSDPSSDQGHGTNVAGIAAGNGSSWAGNPQLAGRYTGTAPDADMMVVNLNTDSDFLQTVVDAVNYIFTKASAMGRPCVINTSVGTYYGSHDGQDLAAQAIDALISAQKSRVLVAAAGNAGGLKFHLSYSLSATDSLFTWFSYNTTYHQVYYDLWADTAQFKLAHFAIGCDNNTPTYLAGTRYFNVLSDFNPAQGVTVQISDSLMQGTTNLGDYTIAVTLSGSTYHVEFYIIPTVTTDLWRLKTIGQGKFDLWASSAAIPGSSTMPTTLPGGFTSPDYRFPDSLETLVSSWQCSDKVITVANFGNRTAYLDYDTAYYPTGYVDGSLISNSSIGPTRDGRVKPDIAATGSTTTSTGDSLYIATLIGANQAYKVSIGGKHCRNGGTSMASPLVAGVAALYLQEHPTASYSEVKQVLEATAKHDNFTTYNIPNINWGWGKVNCYRALLYPVVYGCKDTGSINYNPSANIDTGGCIAKVYGCTDTASINYDSTANVNNGTCVAKVYGIMDTACINYNHNANVSSGNCVAKVYGITDTACTNYNPLANVSSGICIPLGITAINNDISFEIIPNPFSDNATIRINTKVPLVNGSVRFYDILGNAADAINIPDGANEVVYTNTKLAAGIYTASIISNGKIVAIKKVIVD
jgi:subtilisin family serine protease